MLRSLVGSEMCIRDSIYAWSVYVDPINAARDDWTHAGEHATSVVIAALAISCAVSGRVVGGAVSIQLLCLWGGLLAGLGFAVGGLAVGQPDGPVALFCVGALSLIHISEPTRLLSISYAVFCLKKKKKKRKLT
eukprot:TRINITY_DN27208_c0_g1_i2.p1 TRINITY_DN27208_c0_g1~~TRINITY_DN27208_c0_g1_i2.p1  ORF type:complete len:134 (+),score=48.55 TRINITY_DN27208_c0_g1_i2:98-499(+)